MSKPSVKVKLRCRTTGAALTIAWLLALVATSASAQPTTLAGWTYTYPYSGNVEADEIYRDEHQLYYTQTALDKAHNPTTLAISSSIPIDNIRDVTLHQTEQELDVQVWGIRNLSVLVLHFDLDQRTLAQSIAHTVENLQYGGYLPMQNRENIAVNNSSFAASPVR